MFLCLLVASTSSRGLSILGLSEQRNFQNGFRPTSLQESVQFTHPSLPHMSLLFTPAAASKLSVVGQGHLPVSSLWAHVLLSEIPRTLCMDTLKPLQPDFRGGETFPPFTKHPSSLLQGKGVNAGIIWPKHAFDRFQSHIEALATPRSV